MRLQVAIYRQSLPSVNLIYNTKAAANPVATISDLLSALNTVVPLESSDGEWGLEDYIVEVAATSDQEQVYECLHYQFVKDVLREDDEVVVRSLTSEELRERRQGGRLQITTDGRHLVDGIAWGKRWRPQASRPDFDIPPRKRRRLLPPEENDDEVPLQLEYPPRRSQIGTIIEDEYEDEDEEDDEYQDDDTVGETDENGSEDVDSEDELGDDTQDLPGGDAKSRPVHIITRQEFDDADPDEESDDHSISNDEEMENFDANEIEQLLEEAAALEEPMGPSIWDTFLNTTREKRKRQSEDQDEASHEDVVFQGFSSQAKSTNPPPNENGLIVDTLGPYVVKSKPEDVVEASDSSSVASDISSASTSSSGTSESDSEGSSSGEESDSGSYNDSSSSSAASDSSSDKNDSSSDASDSDDEGLSNSDTQNNAVIMITAQSAPISKQNVSAIKQTPASKPPGSGTLRTKANNNRIKRRKLLASLKAAGVLPEDANFESLRDYELGMNNTNEKIAMQDVAPSVTDTSLSTSELQKKKAELLARINADYDDDDDDEEILPLVPADTDMEIAVVNGKGSSNVADGELGDHSMQNAMDIDTPNAANLADNVSTPKRSRLDVESSRRMLFNSLGLRTPKTKAAEEVLREKLAQAVRRPTPRQVDIVEPSETNQDTVDKNDETWKQKLIISAVECVENGVVMTPPPFPFKQRWETNDSTSLPKNVSENQQKQNNSTKIGEYQDTALQTAQNEKTSTTELVTANHTSQGGLMESKTLSAVMTENNDLPMPESFDNLPALSNVDIVEESIIAYKELQLGPKFEPEESSYRVARVLDLQNGTVMLQLSNRDRKQPATIPHDDDGNRILHGLDGPDNDEEAEYDEGFREVDITQMIQPKLILAAHVQVPASADHVSSLSGNAEAQQHSALISGTGSLANSCLSKGGLDQVQIDTPRRQEISAMIKEAGFDSVLDDNLIQPISHLTHLLAGSQDTSSVADHTLDGQELQETSQYVATPAGAISPNPWTSSPGEQLESELLSTSYAYGGKNGNRENETSPPTISIVETVDYPNVSHIMNDSIFNGHSGSSPHQDAQEVTVNTLENFSSLSQARVESSQVGTQATDISAISLPSEVPQSSPNISLNLSSPRHHYDQDADSSMALRGGEGPDISHENLEDADITDSDGLPSLRALTSSQKYRSLSHQSQAEISPPALKKATKSNIKGPNKTDLNRLSPASSLEDSVSDIDFAPAIKVSQSQKPKLSQITEENSIIDLTMSSSPTKPDDELDKDYTESQRSKRPNSRVKRENGMKSGSQPAIRMMNRALESIASSKSIGGRKRSRI